MKPSDIIGKILDGIIQYRIGQMDQELKKFGILGTMLGNSVDGITEEQKDLYRKDGLAAAILIYLDMLHKSGSIKHSDEFLKAVGKLKPEHIRDVLKTAKTAKDVIDEVIRRKGDKGNT